MDFRRVKNILKSQHTLSDDEWKGAVLFLCNEEYVFFIKRSLEMPTHKGQMAFIGGHRLPGEVDPWIVAKREFKEETSLDFQDIEFLGYLPTVVTSNFWPIVPVVGKVLIPTEVFLEKALTNGEWTEIIAYPWKELQNESRWQFAWRQGLTNIPILFHFIRNGTCVSSSHHHSSHLLWGATARMVWNLLQLYYRHETSSY